MNYLNTLSSNGGVVGSGSNGAGGVIGNSKKQPPALDMLGNKRRYNQLDTHN